MEMELARSFCSNRLESVRLAHDLVAKLEQATTPVSNVPACSKLKPALLLLVVILRQLPCGELAMAVMQTPAASLLAHLHWRLLELAPTLGMALRQ